MNNITDNQKKGVNNTGLKNAGSSSPTIISRAYRAAEGGERACNAYRRRNPTCY